MIKQTSFSVIFFLILFPGRAQTKIEPSAIRAKMADPAEGELKSPKNSRRGARHVERTQLSARTRPLQCDHILQPAKSGDWDHRGHTEARGRTTRRKDLGGQGGFGRAH